MSTKIIISFFFCFPFLVQASIVVTGTRVIYPSNAREVTVKLKNNGDSPVLLQSWIDNGDPTVDPADINIPFVLTPPVTRVNSQKGQVLRIRNTNENSLPSDKESIFWLNVLEIPTSVDDGKNKIKIATRTRMKLLYRPDSLKNNTFGSDLEWRVVHDGIRDTLIYKNKSAYFVSLNEFNINSNKIELPLDKALIAPGKSQYIQLNIEAKKNSTIKYTTINDDGALIQFEKSLEK